MRHKVPHRLPKSIFVNDSHFKDGLLTDYYKVSLFRCKLHCQKSAESNLIKLRGFFKSIGRDFFALAYASHGHFTFFL